MLALQVSAWMPWDMVLDFVISFLVWGTVISGLILVVRDCLEADPFYRHHPLETHSPTPTGVCVVDHRGCTGCTVRKVPPTPDQVELQDH